MCGRYTITEPPETIRAHFGYADTPNFPPRYNIAPTQPVPIVRLEGGARHFALVRWGLVPSWAGEIDARGPLINARAETVTRLPSFRGAMRHRRCLFICDGFYEWQKRPHGPKQPWYIRRRGGGPFAMAGLWEDWMNAEGSELESGAVITVATNAALEGIHTRMPAILPPEHYERWLDCTEFRAEAAAELLRPAPDSLMEAWPVSLRVNAIAHDGPELLERAGPERTDPPKPQGDLFD
ncbi:MAG: DUF159 family protein [Hyphomicrobiales bacterium]|nr:MAG: DUF159 family protein [Hyphomicrobiales bacterium]